MFFSILRISATLLLGLAILGINYFFSLTTSLVKLTGPCYLCHNQSLKFFAKSGRQPKSTTTVQHPALAGRMDKTNDERKTKTIPLRKQNPGL